MTVSVSPTTLGTTSNPTDSSVLVPEIGGRGKSAVLHFQTFLLVRHKTLDVIIRENRLELRAG